MNPTIQISPLQIALLFVSFIVVNTLPTIKVNKTDFSLKILHQERPKELAIEPVSLRSLHKNTGIFKPRNRRSLKAYLRNLSRILKHPTNHAKGILSSRNKYLLAVLPNGTIIGISGKPACACRQLQSSNCSSTRIKHDKSKYACLELQSFNASLKRIKAVAADRYIAMTKNGRIVTAKKTTRNSLWIEHHELNGFITYQSFHMVSPNTNNWFLAIKKNGGIKNGQNTTTGMKSTQFTFLRSE